MAKAGMWIAVTAAVVMASGTHSGTAGSHQGGGQPAVTVAARSTAAAAAIRWAFAQRGKPYVYGATGPGSFDCSGLVQAAWAAAGAWIPRTSQEQWATLPHVASPQPGDLVFFPGAAGTWTSPDHVGMVVDPALHLMVQAYDTGTSVETSVYGAAATLGGLSSVVGYARPGG